MITLGNTECPVQLIHHHCNSISEWWWWLWGWWDINRKYGKSAVCGCICVPFWVSARQYTERYCRHSMFNKGSSRIQRRTTDSSLDQHEELKSPSGAIWRCRMRTVCFWHLLPARSGEQHWGMSNDNMKRKHTQKNQCISFVFSYKSMHNCTLRDVKESKIHRS